MIKHLVLLLTTFAIAVLPVGRVIGQENSAENSTDDLSNTANVEIKKELQAVLEPLFDSISKAKVSRATVEMLSDSILNGQVVESETSTFQIASAPPNQFTIYLKQPEQRTRLYCDGKQFIAAMRPMRIFDCPG